MLSLMFLGYLALSAFEVDDVQAGCSKPCPLNWIPFGDYCYQLVLEKRNWADAENYCQALAWGRFRPSHLASVWTAEENQFVVGIIQAAQSIAPSVGSVWLGLTDRKEEGKFEWVDGSGTVDQFNDWSPIDNQPDGLHGADCGYLYEAYGWKWDDTLCDSMLNFICKMKQI